MALPELPAQGQDPWYIPRTAWDNAVKSELEGRLSELEITSTVFSEAVMGALRGQPDRRYHIVAAALRNAGTGWALIDDSAHRPQGISSVSQNSAAITINHPAPEGTSITRVVSLVVAPDDTLALSGITVGASVGLTSSTINLGRVQPLSDFIAYNGTSWVSNSNLFALTWDDATSTLDISHPGLAFYPASAVTLTPSGNGAIPVVSSAAGALSVTSVKVRFVDYTGAYLTTPTTAMRFYVARHGVARVAPENVNTTVYPASNLWVIGVFELT